MSDQAKFALRRSDEKEQLLQPLSTIPFGDNEPTRDRRACYRITAWKFRCPSIEAIVSPHSSDHVHRTLPGQFLRISNCCSVEGLLNA